MFGLKLLIFLVLFINFKFKSSDQSPFEKGYSEVSQLKKEVYANLLKEIRSIDSPTEHYYHQDSDYQKFFGNILLENDKNDFIDDVIYNRKKTKTNSKQKRFLKSLFDKLKPKNKTTKPTTTEEEDIEWDTTTKYATKKLSTKAISSSNVLTTGEASDDAFYKLKQHCSINYDKLCSSKKLEIYELVKKCDKLRIENKGKPLDSCRDVLSIYCYVFYDSFTCLGEDYDAYVPGRKKFPQSSTTSAYSTASSRRIPIVIITTPKSVITTKSTTTTTTKSTTTTKKTPLTTTTTAKTTPKAVSNSNDLISPFDGPVFAIPNDAEKLKKIGSYCLRTKQKDGNCDKMLGLLKEKFKACEKKPKTDSDCQIFKVQFCSAFNNFPCCPDVLAGRTCAGKSNTIRRSYLNM